MKSLFVSEKMSYDGSQLRSLYTYLNYKILGDSILSWCGSCSVDFDKMVDGEDLLEQQEICSDGMLHFIIEIFDRKLFSAVCLQRIMADLCIRELKKISNQKNISQSLYREGDDIYFKDQKLSISVASQSPISSLLHFALNLTNEGTPVKTLSLEDLNVQPEVFSKSVMSAFVIEYESILEATKKVKWVC